MKNMCGPDSFGPFQKSSEPFLTDTACIGSNAAGIVNQRKDDCRCFWISNIMSRWHWRYLMRLMARICAGCMKGIRI